MAKRIVSGLISYTDYICKSVPKESQFKEKLGYMVWHTVAYNSPTRPLKRTLKPILGQYRTSYSPISCKLHNISHINID